MVLCSVVSVLGGKVATDRLLDSAWHHAWEDTEVGAGDRTLMLDTARPLSRQQGTHLKGSGPGPGRMFRQGECLGKRMTGSVGWGGVV